VLSIFKKAKGKAEEQAMVPEASHTNAALLRVQKDLEDLTIDSNVTVSKPNPKNIMSLIATISISDPDSYWCGGTYDFSIEFGPDYPIDPPLCKILTKILHPNIELATGNICLSILKTKWSPVLTLTSIISGLQYLFFDPDPNDPLNHEASAIMRGNEQEFINLVQKTLKGGFHFGFDFKKFM
jgi:ubiquitin-conjugating enzyme E2 M